MFQNNLLMGAAAASSGGASLVSVGNSALFQEANSEYLSRTPGATGVEEKGTFSGWVYKTKLAVNQYVFSAYVSSTNYFQIYFNTSDSLLCSNYSSGVDWTLNTTQLFRDIGWYHIVLGVDTTQGVAANRAKLYVNGVQVTAFDTETYPSLNFVNDFNTSSVPNLIGSWDTTPSYEFDGYMSEVVWIDGTQYAATDFGEFDSSGLYWTPLSSETIKELTFGTNGFYLSNEYDVSSNMTTFVDSGPTAHTITTVNDATHSPLGQKVQNSVIYVDGTDWIKTAQSGHADFTFGTGDFCIEGWFNRVVLSGTANYSYVMDFRYASNNSDRPAIYMDGSNNINYDLNGIKITSSTDPSLGAWFHLAVARNSSTTTMYLNGTAVGNFSDTVDYASGRPWFFQYPQTNSYGFNGYATELRISKGVPRYTGNFTPSTTAFVSDSDTSLLVHSNKFFGAANDSNTPPINFTNNNTVTTTTHTPTNIFGLANSLVKSVITYSNGNKTVATTTGANSRAQSTLPIIGKMKAEFTLNSGTVAIVGIRSITLGVAIEVYYYSGDGTIGGATGSAGATWTTNDVITILVDDDAGTIEFKKNNTSQGGARTINISGYTAGEGDMCFEWGDGGTSSAVTVTIALESGDWAYSDDATFLECSTESIASATTRTASDTNKYFQTVLYEGNGAGQRVGAFQPFTDTFTVAKSALFDSANSETLTRTPSGAGNRRTWTFSTWIKFAPTTGSFTIFNGYGSASDTGTLDIFWSSNKIYLRGWSTNYVYSNMLFEDESQWGNLVMTLDTTQSTSSDRIKGYWNGVELTWGGSSYPSLNAQLGINQAVLHSIGAFNNASGFMGAYLAETVFVDGTALTASSFGQTDTSTNRWIPKAVSGLSLGTNGFYLDYSNSSDLGEDQTGSNDFTNNNTVTQTTDSPTTNYAVLNPNNKASQVVLSIGNTQLGTTVASIYSALCTLPMTTGKYYFEVEDVSSDGTYPVIGVAPAAANVTANAELGDAAIGGIGYRASGAVTQGGSTIQSYASWSSATNVAGCAYDADTGEVWFRASAGWNGDPAAGTGAAGVLSTTEQQSALFGVSGYTHSTSATPRTIFREDGWTYSAPTGFVALAQDNMPDTDQFISAFSWIKNRDATDNHMLFDRVRGPFKDLHSNTTDIEVTNTNTLQSFLAGGVQVGNDAEVNTANESYVLWNWMIETTGSGSSNEDGSINTTSTLVDTTLGMSISTYTGTGSNATVGHGLGVVPECMIVKRLNSTFAWQVYHSSIGNTKFLTLNENYAATTRSTVWNNTTPTSSVFSIGTDGAVNASGGTYVVYCFAPSQFISIGSYTGNGNADGPYIPFINSVDVPISPRWILAKNYEETYGWFTVDQQTSPYNVRNHYLDAATTAVEGTANNFDFVTGGAKFRNTGGWNNSNKGVIYLAIGTPIIDTDGRIIAGR